MVIGLVDVLDWEFGYNNGEVGGSDTDYPITSVEGLEPPDSREDIVDKPADDGAFAFAEFVGPRRITLGGFLIATPGSDFEIKRNELMRIFSNRRVDLPLSINIPGRALKLFVMGKAVKRSYSINLDYSIGYTEWAVQVLCGDPVLYGWDEYSVSAAGTRANAGDHPVNPSLLVTGVAAGPIRITNDTDDGKYIEVATSLLAGEELEIDFKAKTILKVGVSVYGDISIGSRWFKLLPGDNVLSYSGGGTTALKWRDGWLT